MSGHRKQAVLHHTYVNITNHDADINLGLFARLSPPQKRFWFHRGQRVYLWPVLRQNLARIAQDHPDPRSAAASRA